MSSKIREVIPSDYSKLKEYYNDFDKEWDGVTQNPFSKIFVYELEDKIVAFIQYSLIYNRTELDYIYVEEHYRKKGIGSELMDFFLQESICNDCINITLEVNEKNSNGIKLYEKFGFQKVAIRSGYYHGENALLMVRELKKSE